MTGILVLLTNDDGIEAPGLRALERAFARRPDVETWIVAPDSERSTCSHGMTLHQPIFTKEVGERRIALSGLTADCVYFGMFDCLPRRPSVVISGINRGPNLGEDVIYSGTVAGAREAVVRGVHGVAASLVSGDDFERVANSVVEIGLLVARLPVSVPRLLNLNYPAGDFKGPQFAYLGQRSYPEEAERRVVPISGRDYYWLGGPPVRDKLIEGTDGWLVDKGVASATLLSTDQTDKEAMGEGILPFPGANEES